MSGLGLGIDAGGTRTRWALANAHGDIVAEGEVGGLSALQAHADERERLRATLGELACGVLAIGRPARVHAGVTGFGDDAVEMLSLMLMITALEHLTISWT